MTDTQCMVSAATLLTVAASFWGTAAPGVAEQNCPDGVRYNVKPAAQMANQGSGVRAEATLGSCVITFRAGWRRHVTDRGACRVALHEYGHAALGLEHDVGGIMTPGHVENGLPGICWRFSNR